MNAPSYQLNPVEAREGSGGGGARIASTGAYEGQITKAKHIVATTGATGIEFEFESNANDHARFTLYTHNKDGQPIFGAKQLQAMMTILKLRGITPRTATIEEYDFDLRQKQTIQAEIYPDLTRKPLGIVFQMEEYVNNQGEVKSRPNFFAPFEVHTKQLAVEILDQAPAERLQKILATLKDKTIPMSSPATTRSAPPPPPDNFDDDIPF